MRQNDFQIEFAYDGVSYYGLVQPQGPDSDVRYRVSLESENQETLLDVLLLPSSSDLEDWDFQCGDGEEATAYYDKELLEEIGERIEEYLSKNNGGAKEVD
jgi:hypothetical protein